MCCDDDVTALGASCNGQEAELFSQLKRVLPGMMQPEQNIIEALPRHVLVTLQWPEY